MQQQRSHDRVMSGAHVADKVKARPGRDDSADPLTDITATANGESYANDRRVRNHWDLR